MLNLCHLLIVSVYLAGPIVACVHAVRAHRKEKRWVPLKRFRRAALGGTAVGVLVCFVYALASHARMRPDQVAITAYLAMSFILILGWFDRGLWVVAQALFGLRAGRGRALGARVTGAILLRSAVTILVGIPYVLAVALTYHPKESPTTDPDRLYHWSFQSVSFPADVDHTRIAGWWIPAADGVSDRTVILCPGAIGGPGAALPLVRGNVNGSLRDDGYNVLTFDFRGHGDSGGQLVSYGDLERRDVLGAVRWLRQTHPEAARHVVGLGVSTGAAALLAAAADPSPLGQSIDAVAVYAPYDRFDRVVASTIESAYAPPPLGWLAKHVALPLASLQVGGNLAAFSPADAAANLWPRPVLVVHGMSDEVIPFAQGQAVYDAASEPKQSLFIVHCAHAESLQSDAALETIKRYFGSARRMM
jgi:fermentation-respiration switch protein FrsA (DUF1100 family)